MSEEPTLGEVIRRLETVSQQMLDMASQMREDRQHNSATYVRHDVYLAQRQADAAVVADLSSDLRSAGDSHKAEFKGFRDERKSDLTWRRQVLLGLSLTLITAMVAISTAIATLLTR